MSKSRYLEHILAQARGQEKKHHWLRAVEFYEKALDHMKQKDFSQTSTFS